MRAVVLSGLRLPLRQGLRVDGQEQDPGQELLLQDRPRQAGEDVRAELRQAKQREGLPARGECRLPVAAVPGSLASGCLLLRCSASTAVGSGRSKAGRFPLTPIAGCGTLRLFSFVSCDTKEINTT